MTSFDPTSGSPINTSPRISPRGEGAAPTNNNSQQIVSTTLHGTRTVSTNPSTQENWDAVFSQCFEEASIETVSNQLTEIMKEQVKKIVKEQTATMDPENSATAIETLRSFLALGSQSNNQDFVYMYNKSAEDSIRNIDLSQLKLTEDLGDIKNLLQKKSDSAELLGIDLAQLTAHLKEDQELKNLLQKESGSNEIYPINIAS